jgi:hypothetical protein
MRTDDSDEDEDKKDWNEDMRENKIRIKLGLRPTRIRRSRTRFRRVVHDPHSFVQNKNCWSKLERVREWDNRDGKDTTGSDSRLQTPDSRRFSAGTLVRMPAWCLSTLYQTSTCPRDQ